MTSHLLAIDAGTGSVRAVIFNTQGQQVGIYAQEWTHIAEKGVAGSMTFDCDTNWQITQTCIQGAITNAGIDGKSIIALSASSMREGIVVYDGAGNAIWGVANVDSRASEQVAQLNRDHPDWEARYYATSGQTFALSALPRLLWFKQNRPALYEQAQCMTMISDWVLYMLSGVLASDPSNAGTSGIFDLATRQWDKDQAQAAGIKDLFLPVFESGTVIGKVKTDMAQHLGLSKDTLVVMGGGDVQIGTLGLGLTKPHQAAILGGSFWQQVVNIDSKTPPPADMSVRINPHVIAGQSQAEGITFFSGLIMRWFRDAFCDGMDYAQLETKAMQVPLGSYGILPIFSDAMHYGHWIHASPSFIGLGIDPEKYNKYSMFRSLEENAAIISAINLEQIMRFSGAKIDHVVFAGGAAKGKLWAQIVADVLGLPLHIPEVTEATSLGCAMCAGVGAGVWSSFNEAAQAVVKTARVIEPNTDNFEPYQAIKRRWQQVYHAQLTLVQHGLTEPMWKAPGLSTSDSNTMN